MWIDCRLVWFLGAGERERDGRDWGRMRDGMGGDGKMGDGRWRCRGTSTSELSVGLRGCAMGCLSLLGCGCGCRCRGTSCGGRAGCGGGTSSSHVLSVRVSFQR